MHSDFSNEKIFGNLGGLVYPLDIWLCYQLNGLPSFLIFLSGFSALAFEEPSSPAQGSVLTYRRRSPRHIIVMAFTGLCSDNGKSTNEC